MPTVNEAVANFLAKCPSDEDLKLLQEQQLIECLNAAQYAHAKENAARWHAVAEQFSAQNDKWRDAEVELMKLAQQEPKGRVSYKKFIAYQNLLAQFTHVATQEEIKADLAEDELERVTTAHEIVRESLEATLGFVRLNSKGKDAMYTLKKSIAEASAGVDSVEKNTAQRQYRTYVFNKYLEFVGNYCRQSTVNEQEKTGSLEQIITPTIQPTSSQTLLEQE